MKKIVIISFCLFLVSACSSGNNDLIKETDKYGNTVIEVDLNELSNDQLKELKEKGVLLADTVIYDGITNEYFKNRDIDDFNFSNIIFDYNKLPESHPYYGYFKQSETNPYDHGFDIEKIDKIMFELMGYKGTFRENDEYFHKKYEINLDFGRDRFFEYENLEYIGINDNLLLYELNLVNVDYYVAERNDLGKYNLYYRVMKYTDTNKMFLRYIDIKEKQ